MGDNANRTAARTESDRGRPQAEDVTGAAARTAASASEEAARVSRKAADRASQVAESNAEAGIFFARQTGRAAEEISERATELTRQGIETIQKSVESGLEMTSRVAERSMTLFADATGVPSQDGKDAADESLRNMRAIVDSGSLIAKAFQEAGRNWLDRSGERMKSEMDAIEAVWRSRTLTEFTQAQMNLARHHLEGLIAESQHTAELVNRAATTALQKIKAQELRQ